MSILNWLRPPRHVLAIFIAVALVSGAALAWLMWQLLEQDKMVEVQRSRDRLEQLADRAAVKMQSALADLERAAEPPSGVVFVTFRANTISVKPEGQLLYYPQTPARPEAPASRFVEGEQAELTRSDLPVAAVIYERLAGNTDDATRAGALTRLARVQRKMRNHDAAAENYSRLLDFEHVTVSELPADLIAREGRASVFAEANRMTDAVTEAEVFRRDLDGGRWQLTKPQYVFYRSEAESWLGGVQTPPDRDSVARADAVEWVWENRNTSGSEMRRLVVVGDNPAFITSHSTSDGMTAVVAGPAYLSQLCLEAVPDPSFHCSLSDAEGHVVTGQARPASSTAVRTATTSKLPWTLQISAPDLSKDPGSSPRRPLLMWVAAVLTLISFTGAAFIVRAIRREVRATRLQSDFVAAVSHEFRSPLSSLYQVSEMLAGDRLDSDDMRRQAYNVLLRESERLRRLVEELLDFQRLEAGAAVYHFEQIDIGALLQSIVSDFQQRVAATGYEIELRAPESGVHVRADREALSRAISNLLDNAVKYSPEYRTVWVELSSHSDRVSVAVQDHGLGIPVGEQRRIFDRFVRGSESKARRIKGTGIGLAMVHHIVEAHGGEILLASQPGEGSRFTISIPVGVAS